MTEHPINVSIKYKVTGIIVILFSLAALFLLLYLYGNLPIIEALISSTIFICVLTCFGYYFWYVIAYIKVWQAQLAICISIPVICTTIVFALSSLLKISDTQAIIANFPLFLFSGILYWIILVQWYYGLYKRQETIEEKEEENIIASEITELNFIDRISVKDGSRIHILKIEDLLYIQAYGDYVMIYTSASKYIKEQTMKYFEMNLPINFVRIHRSHIINTDQINRIELSGKESYNVHLKNGISLRASSSGYKVLKERLSL